MKKVLMLCKETYTVPLFFLEDKFIKSGYETAMFWIYPEECAYDKCEYNKILYYKIRENTKSKLYDLKQEVENFCSKIDDLDIDERYISEVEKKYTYYKSLNTQLLSSQTTSRSFHFREKFNYTNNTQNKKFLEMAYKKVEFVLDDFMPDYIIDLDSAELLRTVINEVAHYRKIPYITVEYSRYENFIVPTFNLGLQTDDYFKRKYNENFSLAKENLATEYDYIKSFREKHSIMPDKYKGTITAQYKGDSLIKTIYDIIKNILLVKNLDSVRKKTYHNIHKCILFTQFYGAIKDFISYGLLRYKLFKKNKYFKEPCKDDKYIYMPLHLIPESTTFVKSPYYIDELNNIKQISKSLPINWKLYVKEHQSMLGERPLKFYKSVNLLPNAKMVSLNYYTDPKPWIENAEGVITITGTTAYEAALMGKSSIIFGNVFFDVIDGIQKIDKFDNLYKKIKNIGKIDNIHSCAAYIKTVKDVGVEVDVNYLIREGMNILYNNAEESNKFRIELDKLYEFYTKSFRIER